MPIQRIPRYELLLEVRAPRLPLPLCGRRLSRPPGPAGCRSGALQQMLNATPAWHADHALLKSAVKEIKRVADYVNEKKREVEAAAKVKELQAKLSSDCPVRLRPRLGPASRACQQEQLASLGVRGWRSRW